MKIFLPLILAAIYFALCESKQQCSSNEISFPARDCCAGRCTANHASCGGGSCEVLPAGGTGDRNCACSAGFKNTQSKALCVPDCSANPGCVAAGGKCDAPGICNCASASNYFANKQCLPKPECNGDCYGKICDASGCKCATGFYALVNGKCKPTCQG